MTSQLMGSGRRDTVSSSDRTVCDLPEPVAPQTNACRLSVSVRTANGAVGAYAASSTRPTGTRTDPLSACGSGVTSNV